MFRPSGYSYPINLRGEKMNAISLFERQRDAAINGIIDIEGGYIDDPKDSGGPTKYGITIWTLARAMGLPAIHPVLEGKAAHHYQAYETEKAKRAKEIEARKTTGKRRAIIDEDVATISKDNARGIYELVFWTPCVMPDIAITIMVFDWAVNSGPGKAIKRLQELVGVTSDGVIGPITLKAAQEFGPTLLASLTHDRMMFYRALVNQDPKKSKFLNGWMNRIGRVLKLIRKIEAMT